MGSSLNYPMRIAKLAVEDQPPGFWLYQQHSRSSGLPVLALVDADTKRSQLELFQGMPTIVGRCEIVPWAGRSR